MSETDPTLLWILRRAGDEWGPLGVALAAAEFTDREVLIDRLIHPQVSESVFRSPTPPIQDTPDLGEYFYQGDKPKPKRPDPGRTEPGWFDKLKTVLRAREQSKKAREGMPVSFRTAPSKPRQAHECCASKGMTCHDT